MLGVLLLLLSPLIEALPFVTTWNITQANATNITLPPIHTQSSVTVNWGDSSSNSSANAGTLVNFSHTYALPGLYNVSIEGQIFWTNVSGDTLVDIVSWGDGFLVNQSSTTGLFENCRNLRVSAPANTQPVFLPGATLQGMFAYTSFNSSLDWDFVNVTSLSRIFAFTPLNKPITFRNTKGVTSISMMFAATKFNQPFHFDASGLLDASQLFYLASHFNQVVNLTNSSKLNVTDSMFNFADSFNQPIIFDIASVTNMNAMFSYATNFNQPINFLSSSKLLSVVGMFAYAYSFNQPVVMNTSSVTDMSQMFLDATGFTSTLNFTSTAKVTNMGYMFRDVEYFSQDLSSWNTQNVAKCAMFCQWCGLPVFPQCVPCSPRYNNSQNPTVSVCTSGTQSPTITPATPSPTTAARSHSSVSAAASSPPSRGLVIVLLGAMQMTMLCHGTH